MVGPRGTEHRGQGDVRHGTLCVQPFWPPKKHFICGPSKKRTSVVRGSLQPNAVARCAPSMPSRKQPVAQEPCGSVQLVLTDAEGTSESHSSGRPLPSRWSPRPSSSVVSMRWTRGLQTEVLEHMPPCSAPRWLPIACARICVSSVREAPRSCFVVQCCGTSA